MKLLHDIVEDAAQSGTAEVYCCWWNELQHPPFSCINVKPNHFGGERFGFSCGEILTVVSSSYEEFTGSFTGLKQQITEGDEVYIRGIVHNEAERSLKISFGRDPYTLLADRAIVFKDVWDYLDTPRPYEPPVDEEIGEWDDEEEIVSEESASFDALLGIHENAEDQETAYQINTALRTISFRTANPPVLSLAAEEIIGIV
ncbi:hypothetical protein CCAX7_64690 [Capsulimonas corticalis]|uniref:Uncharacterized protein n=1 Tax=Capsulimonas corticalis TaxID=2219043 RepID=A0A402CQT1_9BACT|nr:hypothetical protein CCAX7_64690 [Capsulimonas corticalis]